MRNTLAVVLGLSLLSGMLSAGGCCPTKDEYDKLWALNRNCNDELKKCQDRLRLAEQKVGELEGQLADRDRTIGFLQKDNADLKSQNATLLADLAAAKKALSEAGKITVSALPQGLLDALAALAEKYPTILEIHGNMVKFKADMTFDPGSADIKPAALDALKKLAEILNSPDAKPFNIFVAGHTDDMPLEKPATIAKFEDNWGLSQGRAKSVVKALFDDERGVKQERMGAMGFSKYHPVAPNAPGNKGNVLNRRVEVWIVPNDLLLVPAGGGTAPRTGRTAATPPAN